MNQKQFSIEKFLYLSFFLIAIFLRLIYLDKIPLGDLEAVNALQAYDIVSGNDYQAGDQPGLVSLTTMFFVLFQSSAFIARLIPALCGSFFVLLPFLYKKLTGQKEALFLSFFLAIDPGLIAASRQAQGLVLAVFFIFLAAALIFMERKGVWGGICLAMAILSGPQFISGFLILLVTYFIWRKLFKGDPQLFLEHLDKEQFEKKTLILVTAVALILIGSGFLIYPELLTGIGNSIVSFFNGWHVTDGVPFTRLLLTLLVYEGFLLFFGMSSAVHLFVSKDEKLRFYFIWFLISLGFVLIYPGRQNIDVVWSMIPLGLLAANQAVSIFEMFNEEKWTFLGQSLLVLVIVLFIFNNILGMFNNPLQGNVDWQIRLAGIIGGAVLVVVLSILMWWGWSDSVARNGLLWGIGSFLFIIFLSAGWHSTGLGQSPEAEVWFDANYIQDAELLSDTIASIAEWNMSTAGDPSIIVVDFESPSLRWALKDWQNLEFSSLVSVDASPDFIITPSNQTVEQFAAYTGQDFIWNIQPAWGLILPEEWVNWAFFKTAPLEKESIILWVRSELFPGYETGLSE